MSADAVAVTIISGAFIGVFLWAWLDDKPWY